MFPLNYPNNLSCNYTLTVQHGHRLYFWTDRFSVEYSHNCKADNLSLYDGTGQLLSSWCGTQRRIIYSVTNKMFAVFKSNAHGTSVGIMARHAFQCKSPSIGLIFCNVWDVREGARQYNVAFVNCYCAIENTILHLPVCSYKIRSYGKPASPPRSRLSMPKSRLD